MATVVAEKKSGDEAADTELEELGSVSTTTALDEDDSALLLSQAASRSDAPTTTAAAVAPTQGLGRRRWLSGFLLCLAVVSVSSAGVAFKLIADVPPFLRACWRLEATAALQLPAAVHALFLSRPHVVRPISATRLVSLIVGSGVSLGIHFGAWIWSIDHTTLAASLLFVTAHPVLISSWTMLRTRTFNLREFIGCWTSLAGLAITCLDGFLADDSEMTLSGNAVAFLGAVAMVFYLSIGAQVRPVLRSLYFYVLPVNAVAAVSLYAASWAALETMHSPIGYLLSEPRYFWTVLYLALVPGLLGHTILNYLLTALPMLFISLALLFEPIIGSLMGWWVGVAAMPGWFTVAGAPVVLMGFFLVTRHQP